MRSTLLLLALSAATLASVPPETAAQNPQVREGFFIGGGLAAGTFGCDTCGDREWGPAAYIKLGGTISPALVAGAESSAWTKEIDGVRFTHANVSAIGQLYPATSSGLFLKAGIGFSRLEASASSGPFTGTVSDEGLGLTAGLGYDVRVGVNFSVTPYLSYVWGNYENDFSANHAQIGAGVTWH